MLKDIFVNRIRAAARIIDPKRMKLSICIGRQCGSGGHEIGLQLSRRMNIPFYDDARVLQIIKKDLSDQNSLECCDEDSLVPPFPLPEATIRRLFMNGNCVIVGRCAQWILRGRERSISVFIYAPREDRIQRIAGKSGVPIEEAHEIVCETDNFRSIYYDYYMLQKWGVMESYDYCLNSSLLGIEGSVELLLTILEDIKRKKKGSVKNDKM